MLICIAAFAAGCSKTIKYSSSAAEASRPTDPKSVKVVPIDVLANGEYQMLTSLFVRHKGGIMMGKGADDVQETVVQAAAKLGADVVIGFKTGTQDDSHAKSGNSRWGTGLAARGVSDNSQSAARCTFIVALCGNRAQSYEEWKVELEQHAPQAGKEVSQQAGHQQTTAKPAVDLSYERFKKDSLLLESTWQFVVSAAEYHLAKRGYYALIQEFNQQNIDSETISKYIASDPNRVFGDVAGHVMFVDLGVSRSNAGFVRSASTDVKAALYAYGSDVPVWSGSARKSGQTWGLVDNLLGGWLSGETDQSRSQKAAIKTVKELFKTLKPLN